MTQLDKDERAVREALEKEAEAAAAEMVINIATFFQGKAALLIRPTKGGGIEVRFNKD